MLRFSTISQVVVAVVVVQCRLYNHASTATNFVIFCASSLPIDAAAAAAAAAARDGVEWPQFR